MAAMSKRWSFTCWDVTGPIPVPECEYMIYQLERATTTSGLHYQGYIRFARNQRITSFKKLAHPWPEMHLEQSRGSEEHNRAYCTKRETAVDPPVVVEHGTYDPKSGRQGRRTDLDEVTAMAVAGATAREIALAHPAAIVKYPSGVDRLIALVVPPPPARREVRVHVIWGLPGVGKSTRLHTSGLDLYTVGEPGRDPFGDYVSQPAILIDEFDPSDWTITKMNRYLDVWPLTIDARYRNRPAYWDRVFILSNIDPATWYFGHPLRPALLRRLHVITHMTSFEQAFEL